MEKGVMHAIFRGVALSGFELGHPDVAGALTHAEDDLVAGHGQGIIERNITLTKRPPIEIAGINRVQSWYKLSFISCHKPVGYFAAT